MRTNHLLVGLVMMEFVLATNAQGAPAQSSQKVLLKNWAMSRCIAEVYADKATKDDANATAAAYLEAGHQPIEAYEQLGALVSKFAQRKYSSSTGSELNAMKCIDLLNSKELDKLAGELAKKK